MFPACFRIGVAGLGGEVPVRTFLPTVVMAMLVLSLPSAVQAAGNTELIRRIEAVSFGSYVIPLLMVLLAALATALMMLSRGRK